MHFYFVSSISLISYFHFQIRYSVKLEYPTQPGYGNNRGPKSGFISRTQEGKFVIDPEEEPFNQQQQRTRATDEGGDEGGFDVQLPPNRFRTRSVAIVAGYSPERLYSNMPAGAFVVESGMYKVNSGRSRGAAVGGDPVEQWERPEPVYWKQVRTEVFKISQKLHSLNASINIIYDDL